MMRTSEYGLPTEYLWPTEHMPLSSDYVMRASEAGLLSSEYVRLSMK